MTSPSAHYEYDGLKDCYWLSAYKSCYLGLYVYFSLDSGL